MGGEHVGLHSILVNSILEGMKHFTFASWEQFDPLYSNHGLPEPFRKVQRRLYRTDSFGNLYSGERNASVILEADFFEKSALIYDFSHDQSNS